MVASKRVARGVSSREIKPRRGGIGEPGVIESLAKEARLRIVEQPELQLSEKLVRRRRDVVIPRFTKLLEACENFRQVGNDEHYGLTPGEKEYLFGMLWSKVTEVRNTFKYGRRGPRYATVEDLLRHAGPGSDIPDQGDDYGDKF